MTITDVTTTAASAAPALAASTAADRAGWLRAIADRFDAHVDELAQLAHEETHLDLARLTGEVARTTGQLRLFAEVVTEGSYLEVTIDHARPELTPPRPDLRRMLVPLGAVAVFSASNFPFAFSVAGGDTASALAAGCPVVVKGHPAHPRLSRRTAELVTAALADAGAPAGAFGHVTGHEEGRQLVLDPGIRAVGFTGSLGGGRALFDLAVGRPDPIPFYGELSALNPVLVTPAAAAERGAELALGLIGSMTMGVGQFCTKPGLVLVPDGGGFEAAVAEQFGTRPAAPMLTAGMSEAFAKRLAEVAAVPGVTVVAGSLETPSAGEGVPVVLATDVATLLAHPDALLEESFGPTTLLVRYRDEAEALGAIRAVGGSLTATLHSQPADDISAIVPVLRDLAGRVLFEGWPTGVAVTWAQQHGGPWPSTTSSLHTSVGATSIRRWLRPVSYQSAPETALPVELRDANPLGIPRRVDGVLG